VTGLTTGRPTPGRLVTRDAKGHVQTSHRAWLFAGRYLTHCGRTYLGRPGRFRVFVAAPWLPVSCKTCLRDD
jgi:hypothetical protein